MGTFTWLPAQPLLTGTDFETFDDVADLDGDGLQDLVIKKSEVLSLPYHQRIVWGAPAGITPLVTTIPTSYDYLVTPRVTDFDLDGVPDILLEGVPSYFTTPHDVLLFRGLGARQFSPAILLMTSAPQYSTATTRLAVSDVDGDHDADLVRMNNGVFPATLVVLQNQTIYAAGCPGTGGVTPSASVGTATPGNAVFAIGVHSALANAPAALGVSLARVAVAGCGVAIDLGAANLILPAPPVGIGSTDASGSATLALPLPPAPALSGMAFYVQWGVLDPQGAMPAAGTNFALSAARTVFVW
jgi:hypothetical protein